MLSEMSQKRKINTARCDITYMWNLKKRKKGGKKLKHRNRE